MAWFFLIVHIIASLLVVFLAIYDIVLVIRRASIQHREIRLDQSIRPLIIAKSTKAHVVEKLIKEGFPSDEVDEVYERILSEMNLRR
jgi:hypothetical protein